MEIQLLGKLELALLLQLIGLAVVVTADSYLQKTQKRILLLIVVLALSLAVQDRWSTLPESGRFGETFRTILLIYGYSIRPVILVLYLKTLDMNRNRSLLWWLVAVNAVVYSSALFSGAAFRMTEENLFVSWPIAFSGNVLCTGLLALLVYESLQKSRQKKAVSCVILVMNAGLILAAAAWDRMQNSGGPVSSLTVVMVSSCLFYYLWLHMQSAYAHEQALEAEQRIQIMMTQIQPHFLFNTLSTIQALCRIDPEKAFETTEKFGTYLRMNIDSLSQASLIPFQKELEHTKIYADIEMIRRRNLEHLLSVFSDRERASIEQAASPELCFTRLWTRKESYLKLTGEGLTGTKALREIPTEGTDMIHFETVIREAEDFLYSVCQWTADPP